jgi:aerobic C4-dicarboxylate transport protein
LVGSFQARARKLKPLGDGFIKLIKMVIAPIIFCTVVHGIASMSDLKKLGRRRREDAGLFRSGFDGRSDHRLVVVNVLKPGPASISIRARSIPISPPITWRKRATSARPSFLLNIIPTFSSTPSPRRTAASPARGHSHGVRPQCPRRARAIAMLHAIDTIAQLFFAIVNFIVRLAPIGAFGAMASPSVKVWSAGPVSPWVLYDGRLLHHGCDLCARRASA